MTTFEVSVFDLLVLLGALQGIILGIILMTNPRLRKKSNVYLALLLITFSILNIEGFLNNNIKDAGHSIFIMSLVCFTPIPICLYFFMKYLMDAKSKMNHYEWLLFIPIVIELFVRNLPTARFSSSVASFKIVFSEVTESLCIGGTIILIVSSIIQLSKYEKALYQQYSQVEEKSLQWLRNTFLAGLLLAGLWLTINAISFTPEFNYLLGYIIWIGMSILIYWIGFSMLIKQELLQSDIFGISDQSTISSPELSPKADDHYQRIIKLVEDKELYLDPDFNMSKLSETSGLSNGYLSQIINTKGESNFFELINRYRVTEVISKMNDENLDHFTILAIAFDSGFKSKSTFNSVFKKSTGMTPSTYRKGLKPTNL